MALLGDFIVAVPACGLTYRHSPSGRRCSNALLVSSLLHQNPRAIVIMIAFFRHKGLRRFYESGSLAGIQPRHANRLGILLLALDSAATAADLDLPGFGLHALKAAQPVRWSVWVSGNWRTTYEFMRAMPTCLTMRIIINGHV